MEKEKNILLKNILKYINKLANKINKTINKILDMDRIEKGVLSKKIDPTSILELIDKSISYC